MKKERILLLGGNFYPEPTGIGKYNGEMIEWLAKEGHDCTVVTTYPYYPHWKVQEPYTGKAFWFKTEKIPVGNGNSMKVIRCPHYIPKDPSGVHRVISEFSFFFCAYLVMLVFLFKRKFNYVITVAPPFTVGLLGLLYKMIRGGKLLYHIQDLQIDAARDLVLIESNGLIKFFLSIERFILKNADWVSTISEGMRRKVKIKCNKDALLFPNWVDIKTFYPLHAKSALKAEYGFEPTDMVFLYAGAIGHKQGLEEVLHSAKVLEHLPNIKFAICGCGPYKQNLMRLKDELNCENVVFLPLQPVSNFNAFLNMADVHLVLQKKGVSDLVLPSKLSTIFSVGGLAIVTAAENTSLYNLINAANAGILINPGDREALIGAIKSIGNLEHEEKSINARKYAENNLSKNKILSEYFVKIFKNEDIIPENKVVMANA